MVFVIIHLFISGLIFGYYSYYHERIFKQQITNQKNKSLKIVIIICSIAASIFVPVTPIIAFKYIFMNTVDSARHLGVIIFLHLACYVLALIVAIRIKKRFEAKQRK